MSSSDITVKKFTATTSTSPDFTATGTVSTVNGFKKIAVTAVSGSGGPSIGDKVYGLEVPGLAVILKPVETSNPDQVVVAVAAGSCPTSTLNANWVIVKQGASSNVSNAGTDTFGTFSFSPTTGVASVVTRYSLSALTTDLGGNAFASATCSNGIMTVSNSGDTAVMYLTAGGGAIVNTASSNSSNTQFIFGLPVASVTASSFAGTYSGFIYLGNQATGSKFKPVKITLTAGSSTLSGTGNIVTDVDSDAVSSTESATINLTTMNSPSTGLMTGTMVSSGGTTNLACMGVSNANSSGKQIINCASADAGNTAKLSNFLLVSR